MPNRPGMLTSVRHVPPTPIYNLQLAARCHRKPLVHPVVPRDPRNREIASHPQPRRRHTKQQRHPRRTMKKDSPEMPQHDDRYPTAQRTRRRVKPEETKNTKKGAGRLTPADRAGGGDVVKSERATWAFLLSSINL